MANPLRNEMQVIVKSPATGEIRKEFTVQTQKEAEKYIEDSHEAFKTWKLTSFEESASILNKMAALLRNNKKALAKMSTEQMGKAISQAEGEIDSCAVIYEYNAENGAKFLADEKLEMDNGRAIITYQPIGVILAMQPWNFPFYQVIRYSAANIMAGNTTLLKHAEICWDTARRIQELYEQAGLPKDVFNVIYVDNETVDELIAHDKVRGVTLTGSTAAGKIVAEIAGKHLKKTVLKLGGSDPYIILEDAQLDDAVQTCVQGRINNAGQTCIAAKRFIVLESIYDAFKEKFVAAMQAVTYGDPMQQDCQRAPPLAREDLRDKLHQQVQDSVKSGATLLTGGEIPSGKGYFYPATVLENVNPGMPAYEEELFGPVASLIKAKDELEAIKIANDNVYGLGGGVMSANTERAIELAKKIDTGMVNINGYALSQMSLPFGGVK